MRKRLRVGRILVLTGAVAAGIIAMRGIIGGFAACEGKENIGVYNGGESIDTYDNVVLAPETSTAHIDEDAGGLPGAARSGESENNDDSDWKLLLVNRWNMLPDDFSVELKDMGNLHSIDKRAYDDLNAMLNAARDEGLSPIICSSYRTNEKQQALYLNKVNSYIAQGYTREAAEAEARKWISVPGTSEHQTGLAVDIVALSYQLLDEHQENTAEQKWLMENSYKYGFILRYPEEKSDVTGVNYEPWHYRYVGKDAAKEIYAQGICLEEYIENLQAQRD